MAFRFKSGTSPILVSIPHNGSAIPETIAASMTEDGRASRDTDWFLDRLYDIPELQTASVIAAEYSRYVIDLNRPRDNVSLYPGQTTTGLIPQTCFDGAAIYNGNGPDAAETEQRVEDIWVPYHAKIEEELNRLQENHGIAVLIEAHSIASVVPRLFDGALPDFNLGSNQGESCEAGLVAAMMNVLLEEAGYSHIVNGRFVGGYITRHFGQPGKNIHAIQIELSQATYMNENDLSWDDGKASKVQLVFRKLVSAIASWIESQKHEIRKNLNQGNQSQ